MMGLSANEESFLAMMCKSDEHAQKGFELLMKRSDPVRFLDGLMERGLLGPDKNPAPVPVSPDGYVRLPYWAALDYLEACARVAGKADDRHLARKLLGIIRAVDAGSARNASRDNFHTLRKFAEIIGLLPVGAVSTEDLELVENWLQTKFDRRSVAHALDEGILGRFLASDAETEWEKALQLVRYCTAVRWEPSRYSPDVEEPVAVVEEYWLSELIAHHAGSLGSRKAVAADAAKLFAERVAEVFGPRAGAHHSYVYRLSRRDRNSGRRDRSVANCMVDGLRDVLVAWCDVDDDGARLFVEALLNDDNEMLRRVGLLVVGERWEHLGRLFFPLVDPEFFGGGHSDEVEALLRENFEGFSDTGKAATLEAIQRLPTPTGADGAKRRELKQRRWLSALGGTYEPAVELLRVLTEKYGPQPDYSDGATFVEGVWGPGTSPYSADELLALAEEGSLPERLCALEKTATGRRSVEAVVAQLERAVQGAPVEFAGVLPVFLAASRRYQYAVIRGFLKLRRDAKEETASIHWESVWNRLFDFFEQLLQDPDFWKIEESRDGAEIHGEIADTIADLLDDGSRDDSRAYPTSLLPRGWRLIQILVEHAKAATVPTSDPMFEAINSPKGRAVEAAFNHILRRCRLADEETGSHVKIFDETREFMERELALCVGKNFEFSTLCGAYLPNLGYIDASWLEDRIGRVFPKDHPGNFDCALAGLAYASTNRRTYRLLRDAGVMDAALPREVKGRDGRKKLMEMLMLGYLWGEEKTDSPRLAYLFESSRAEDLELVNSFLWSIRRDELKPEQVEKIVDYWRRCVDWASGVEPPPRSVLSGLSGLTTFLESVTAENRDLLLTVAPYVDVHRNGYEFLDELNRLVKDSPTEVCDVVATFIDTHEPFYDYKDKMRSLVGRLAELGCRADAIKFCDRLRSMSGLAELYSQLTTDPPS